MNPSIRLVESSSEISALCRAVEEKLSAAHELDEMNLPVEVLENFSQLPEAGQIQAVKDTSAAYRKSTNSLYVNRSIFMLLAADAQAAVLAHEIAHAFAHRDSLMEKLPLYAAFGPFGEEFLADRLACKWGFFEGLRNERLSSYKQAYVDALKNWEDEGMYCKAMSLWHIKKLAGLV